MNFYKRYKERKNQKRLNAEKQHIAERDKATQNILKYENAMLNKTCPFCSGFGEVKCFKNCIHFQHGEVYYQYPIPHKHNIAPGYWVINYPKCKLWGNK